LLDDLRTSGVISRKKNLKKEGPWSTLSHEDSGDNQGRTEGLENLLDDLRTSGVIFRKKNLKEEGPWSTLSHQDSGDNQGRNNDRIESVWKYRDGPPTPASHNRIDKRGVRPSLLRQRCEGLLSLFDEDREKVTRVPSFLKRPSIYLRQ
jgi:hypothetical protein